MLTAAAVFLYARRRLEVLVYGRQEQTDPVMSGGVIYDLNEY